MHTFKEDITRKKIITVICEGPSEVAYLNELSKALREEGIAVKFSAKPQGGGGFSTTVKKYKEQKAKERKSTNIAPVIWVDKDRYARSKSENEAYFKRGTFIPEFFFNYYNFEDMLILHCPLEKIEKWQKICEEKGHFSAPLKASEYMLLFRKHVFPNYEKGTLPIDINMDTLKTAVENNNNPNLKFKSDFLNFLEQELNIYK